MIQLKNTLCFSLILLNHFCFSQEDSLSIELKPVTVSVNRIEELEIKVPNSVFIKNKKDFEIGSRQLSIYEGLQGISGLFAMNQNNFSKDLRVSIRGNGARSSFGIRGIRIFTDGFPEGTPDGQVDVDNVDPSIINRLEVVKGAVSSFYGNAAGGVILLKSEMPEINQPIQEIQLSAGSFGYFKQQLKFGKAYNKINYLFTLSHNKIDGYRQNSEMESSIINGKFYYTFSPKFDLNFYLNYANSPYAQDAGSVNYDTFINQPKEANKNNLNFKAGEKVQQGRIGGLLRKQLKNSEINFRAFYTNRKIENRLPIIANGDGSVGRNFYGLMLDYKIAINQNNLFKVGIDYNSQNDLRKRFSLKQDPNNKAEYIQDKIVLNQNEYFKDMGLYFIESLNLFKTLHVNLSLRYDNINLKLLDNYAQDGIQDGLKRYNTVNPTIGVNFNFLPNYSLYSQFSTSFETPTLNELSNNPTGLGGFNENLNPKKAKALEIGLKGLIANSKLKYDVCFFFAREKNDWVPYEIKGFQGKTFYRNSGIINKKGIELFLAWSFIKNWQIQFSSTSNDFKYIKYEVDSVNYSGNFLPGIPKYFSNLSLKYNPNKGLNFNLESIYNDRNFANDANNAFAPSYFLVNFQVSYLLSKAKVQYNFFLNLNNVFNSKYADNLVINAVGGRYYEAGNPRNFFGGLKIGLK